jgi:hypothetical protein
VIKTYFLSQLSKEKVQIDKQRSAKYTYKTKDRATRTQLKTGGELLKIEENNNRI